MNSRVIIFLFLALISENVFSQKGISDSIHVKEYLELYQSKESTDKSLSEANDRIKLLEKYAEKKEDSLRACLNPKNEEKLEHSSLVNAGKYYALIIAVSKYKNERTFTYLPEAVNDGAELKEVLEENYFFERVELLENPTKKAIGMKFDGLITEVTNNDNVLIFYAGHGYMWKDKRRKGGYWCPADAEFQVNSTLLNDYEILNILEMIESKNMLLISDACHASSITRTRSVNAPKSLITQVKHD